MLVQAVPVVPAVREVPGVLGLGQQTDVLALATIAPHVPMLPAPTWALKQQASMCVEM